MELTEERTGFVRVHMSNGFKRYVEAKSFGEAASMIKVGSGQILSFEWITKDQYIKGDRGDLK